MCNADRCGIATMHQNLMYIVILTIDFIILQKNFQYWLGICRGISFSQLDKFKDTVST